MTDMESQCKTHGLTPFREVWPTACRCVQRLAAEAALPVYHDSTGFARVTLIYKRKGPNRSSGLFLVRKMGLEPTRHRHTHLKRACLPIPALPQIAFDCKKDSSTFGGIKSSPILQLFPAWGHLSKVSIYFYAQCQGWLKLYAHNRQSFLSRFVVSYETSSFT